MSQTTYNQYQDALQMGSPYMAYPHKIVSRTAEAEIFVGRGVAQPSADGNLVKLPDGTDTACFGVAVLTTRLEKAAFASGENVLSYKANDLVGVMREGLIAVWAEEAVSESDAVYMRHTVNGAGTAPGQFRNDADTANAVLVEGARFATSVTAAGIVLLELNLPQN